MKQSAVENFDILPFSHYDLRSETLVYHYRKLQ